MFSLPAELPIQINFFCAEKKNKKAAELQIDKVWKKRITSGDPFEACLQQEKVCC